MKNFNIRVFYISLMLSCVVCVVSDSSSGVIPTNRNIRMKDKSTFDLKQCSGSRNAGALLSRKKRALSFADGGLFVITVSLVKALLIGLPLGWNITLEIDVIYKTPSWRELIKMNKAGKLRILHHRQRRDMWQRFENVLNHYGIDGQPCILRTICEAQQYLAPKDTVLIHDVLKLLFSAPDFGEPHDVYSEAHNAIDCKMYEKMCPISLLEVLLSYSKT